MLKITWSSPSIYPTTLNTGGKIHKTHLNNDVISISDFEPRETTIINTAESHEYFFVANFVAENRVPTITPNATKAKWL